MQTKKLILLSILATMLACSILSVAAAQDTPRSPAPEVSSPSDAAPLIAPAADENTTASSDDYTYHTQDENATVPTDAEVTGAEDASLFATNTTAAPDNTLVFFAIGVLTVVIGCGAVGAAYYRRNASKQQT
jgi:hypothetical protein